MTSLDAILDDAFAAATGRKPSPQTPAARETVDRDRMRQARRLLIEGYGVDDVRIKTGLSYLLIWGCLRKAQRLPALRPYERIALMRASDEQGFRRRK